MKLMKLMSMGLLLACASCSQNVQQESTDPQDTDAALEKIMTRVSVRQYTDQKLDEATIDKLLRAGMAAPSAADVRPWSFVVVDDPAIKQALADSIHTAGPAARAPQVIVVCGNMEKTFPGDAHEYWVQDCSAAMENMLVAAHAMGLGAVWMGVYPQQARVKIVSELLKLPSTIMPLGAMAVGYPAESPSVKDKYDASLIHTNNW